MEYIGIKIEGQDKVLILIIMEDTHGVVLISVLYLTLLVLILIIMEDTHGDQLKKAAEDKNRLNPYYNGRYSWSKTDIFNGCSDKGLNPYYNGRYSWRATVSVAQPL